jgi:hypothetical protein
MPATKQRVWREYPTRPLPRTKRTKPRRQYRFGLRSISGGVVYFSHRLTNVEVQKFTRRRPTYERRPRQVNAVGCFLAVITAVLNRYFPNLQPRCSLCNSANCGIA